MENPVEDTDDFLEEYIKDNYNVFDRFTFDCLFRRLLKDGYDHEEAKDTILHQCALSALVLQERIRNEYYYKISEDDEISDDLLELRNEMILKHFPHRMN